MADTFLREAFVRVSAQADPVQFRTATQRAVDQGLAGINPTITPQLSGDKAKADAAVLKTQLKATFDRLSATLDLNTADGQLKLAKFAASADSLQRKLSRENLDLQGVDKARLQLLGLQIQADKLNATLDKSKVAGLAGALAKTALTTGTEAGKTGSSGAQGLLSTPGVGPAVAVAGAAVAAALAPFIAQGISISMVAGFGAGIAGIAAYGASKTALVQQSFANLKTAAGKDLADIGKPFAPMMDGLLYTAQGVLGTLTPVFQHAAATIATALGPAGSALESAFASPAVQTAIQAVAGAFASLVKSVTPQLSQDVGKIADQVTSLAKTVASNPRAFSDFVGFLTNVAEISIQVIAGLDKAANYIEGHWTQISAAIEQPFLVFSHGVQIIKDTISGIEEVLGPGLTDALTLLDIFRNNTRLVWDQVELDALNMASKVTEIMGKLPGPLGAPFRAAHTAIAHDLAGIEANVATTESQINADWAKIHDTAVITVRADGTFKVGTTGPVAEAMGGLITGGIPGRDSVLAKLMPGEVVVPTNLVNAGAVDHLRGRLPGFAAGGVVGSYSGNVPGLGPWMGRESQAALKALEAATAAATAAAMKAAQTAAAVTGGGHQSAAMSQIEAWWTGAGGPGGNTAHIAAAITGAESGFNVKAVQAGQPYATTGWGLWQITPGNSEPQFGINQALLTGPTNAGAAVAKYRGAGGTFRPWTTYEDGAYLRFYAGGTPGAAKGWAVVGEAGPELVKMRGGERVISNHAMRGYAAGTGTPKQQAAWLKELGADVAAENKLVAARTKHRKALALGIYQAELYDIQHPKDKGGPKKLKALEKANTAYLAASAKPIAKLQAEVALLRALTGDPSNPKYGGPGSASTSASGTSSAVTSAGGTSSAGASGTSSAASAAALAADQAQAAQEMKAFAQGILPNAGGVTSAGIGTGSASGASASAGGIGAMFPAASTPRTPDTGPAAGGNQAVLQALGAILDVHRRTLTATQAIPGQTTAGMQAVMGGVARGARQGTRFNTRG